MKGFFLVMIEHPEGWYPSMVPDPQFVRTRAQAERITGDMRRAFSSAKTVSANAAAFADELLTLAIDLQHQLHTDSDLDTVTAAERYRQFDQALRELLTKIGIDVEHGPAPCSQGPSSSS